MSESIPTPSPVGTMKRERSASGAEETAAAVKRVNTGQVAEDGDEEAQVGDGGADSALAIKTEAQGDGDVEMKPATPNPTDEHNEDPSSAGGAGGAGLTDDIPKDPATQVINMRCLIVTQDASIIIGKNGRHVNEIREKSNARVNVSESIPGNPERILSVQGPLDAVSKAFGLIVRRINDEPFEQPSVPGSRAVTIKFIIPNSRMGSVIGKGGAKIKEIQEASGARLNASESMLPGSTERVLSVAGVADAVHIAVYYIGTILLEFQDRVGSGGPSSAAGQYRQNPPVGGGGGYGSSGGGGGGGGYGGGAGPVGGMPPQQQQQAVMPGATVQQFWIPNELVGSIIGKGGVKINEIRTQSQCAIRVTDPGTPAVAGGPVSPNERLVIIQGAPMQITAAVAMLHSRLEAEKLKKTQMGGY